ncbi:AraC family transcriptional regulator [Pendulispora brunnea]|uniref:AraC family transcriptional regulator n=1 Tax=Pendulispora brunnea TaxID=2905690 RepID=A0ABZ2JZC8_9BACT
MGKPFDSTDERIQSFFIPTVVAYVRALGGNAEALERKFGIPAGLPMHEGILAPFHLIRDVSEDAAELLGDPFLGLHLALAHKRGSYGPPSAPTRCAWVVEFAARSAPTLGAAILRFARYQHLVNNLRPFVIESGTDDLVIHHRHGIGRQLHEFTLALVLNMMREFSSQDIHPHRVGFIHSRPTDISELVQFFGTERIDFGQEANTLVFAARIAELPIQPMDEDLLALLDSFVQRDASPTNGKDDPIAPVRRYVHEALRDGTPSVERAAAVVRTSVRTLQRRLDEAGTTFNKLVDEVRRALALQYLQNAELSVSEVAFLIGYSDVRPFARAFRRWTGSTPGEYRASFDATASR